MRSVISTLFEGHYHYGVAALANSLCEKGFKGDIYAGYLGELPDWARISSSVHYDGHKMDIFNVDENVNIYFVRLKTDYHLTNYKPDFLKWIVEGPASDAGRAFYFDPDIVVKYAWSFFEEWVTYGVAVCEDINSPLPLNHPRRMAWKKHFADSAIELNFKECYYANGGFIGLDKKDFGFLSLWQTVQENFAHLIGGLNRSSLPGKGCLQDESVMGDYAAFGKTDQDALNITIGAWKGNVSVVGKEGMALQSGPALMFHALGVPKPWKFHFLKQCINGNNPRLVDKMFWRSVKTPIKLYSPAFILRKNLAINLSVFISRFYRK
jgi:hypothetical protein